MMNVSGICRITNANTRAFASGSKSIEFGIKKQSRESAERLYDIIAPHLGYKTLRSTANTLKKIRVNKKFPTVVRHVDRAFGFISNQTKNSSWLKIVLSEYLSGNLDPGTNSSNDIYAASAAGSDDISREILPKEEFMNKMMAHPTFVPVANREHFIDNVKILMTARERNVLGDNPIFFSEGTARKFNGKRNELISPEVKVCFERKDETQRQKEAEHIANMLADRLPSTAHRKIYEYLQKISRGNARKNIYYLKNIQRICSFHCHLVLTELAEFLHIKLPKFSDETFLAESWRDWNAVRDELSQSFLEAQHRFATEYEGKVTEKPVHGDKLFETIQQELKDLRANAHDNVPQRQGRTAVGNSPRINLLRFEGIFLSPNEKERIESEYKTKADRTIFLDNLPIDVDHEELLDVYSRCGDIESVKIFNVRADLDPGAKSLDGKKLTPKKSLARGVFHDRSSRTPVYALIKFATNEGYERVTDINLRIFGVILRRHAVRTRLCSEFKTLYIENIQGFFALDLEYKLCKALHPYIVVCSKRGQNDLAQPSACRIDFPSHEVASFAFDQLTKIDMGSDDCVMNWMKTPTNAMKYWKREL